MHSMACIYSHDNTPNNDAAPQLAWSKLNSAYVNSATKS